MPPAASMQVVSWLTAVGPAGSSRRTVIEYETLGAVVMRPIVACPVLCGRGGRRSGAAGALVGVHRGVGTVGCRGDADRGAYRVAVRGHGGVELGTHALGERRLVVRPADEERELVPAEARHHVAVLPHAASQGRGAGPEQRVAGGVPAAVIDPLELVEVHERERDRRPVVHDPLGTAQGLVPGVATGDAGEGVLEGLVP